MLHKTSDTMLSENEGDWIVDNEDTVIIKASTVFEVV